MSTPIISFRKDFGDVHVDLPMLLDTRFLVQGSSRSGKTHFLFYMLEQTHGKVLQWVVDREADFVVLREKFNYVIVGGEGGDIPIDLKTRRGFETLIRKLLELRLNTIFDVSELDEDQRVETVSRLCTELSNIPRSSGLWQQMLFLIDELQHYAPEKGKPLAGEAIGKLTSVGGKRGFCVIGATQALAEVSKSAIRQLENKVILRTGAVDAERAARELRMKNDVIPELRSFDKGVGYAYGPAIALDPILIETPAKLEIYPPKRGELRPPPPPPPNAVRKLIAQLPDATAAAEAEAASLEQANTEIARLRRELKRVQKGQPATTAPDPAALQKQVDAAVARAHRVFDASLKEHARARDQVERQLRTEITRLEHAANDEVDRIRLGAGKIAMAVSRSLGRAFAELGVAQEALNKFGELTGTEIKAAEIAAAPTSPKALPAAPRPARKARQTRTAQSPVPIPAEDPTLRAGLSSTCLRILDTIGALHSLGLEEVARATIGGWCNLSYKAGSFGNRLTDLRNAGLIEDRPEKKVALTEQGLAAAAQMDIPDLATLHETWIERLPGTAGRILRILIDAYPNPVSREEIGRQLGIDHKAGSFGNRLTDLRTPGLARDVSKTELVATELVFPEGLR